MMLRIEIIEDGAICRVNIYLATGHVLRNARMKKKDVLLAVRKFGVKIEFKAEESGQAKSAA